jgi:phosphoglycolate phosphatase-like HAD superfamily hydrolase
LFVVKPIDTLISDADGTLINTVQLIRHGQYETAKQYLISHGAPNQDIPSYDDYELALNSVVGGPARETLESTVRKLYIDRPHLIDGVDFDRLHALLDPTQDTLAREYVRAYDGLSALLYALGQHNIKLAISTSGTKYHTVRNFGIALPDLGLTDLYQDASLNIDQKLAIFADKVSSTYNIPAFTVVTADDTNLHKPNPEPFLLAAEMLQANIESTAVLGDHSADMLTAVNAGIKTRIGITHGFSDQQTLINTGATTTISSLGGVVDLLS